LPVNDYSTTASSNTAISGIDIAEGCPPASLNNAIRQLMADIAGWRTGGVVPSYTANFSAGGSITAGTELDGTTTAANFAGVRVRGRSDGGEARLQFTNNAASAQWGALIVNSSGVANWEGQFQENGARVVTNVATSLGYTPANRAGDTFTGSLRVLGLVDVDTPGPSSTGGIRIRGTTASANIAYIQFINASATAEWGNIGVGSDGRATYNGAGGFAINGSLIGSNAYRNVTISTSTPSGGADGDIWLQY
jgi:hypothetical protein